jgi:ATP-binding cassette, subfamily B, bacterial
VRVLQDATSILIALRLSTVTAADRFVVMDNGTIIEEGNHAQLLKRGEHYANLYNTYFRHRSLDYRLDWVEGARAARLKIAFDDSK